jgi:hypothetical protein
VKSTLGAVATLLTLVACSPREVTWERAGIRYTKRVDDPSVTADVLDDMLRHRDVIGAYLHLQPPAGSVLEYRKFVDREDIAKRGHCSAVSAGCYFDQFGVESKQPLDAHELIHAYTAYLGTKPKIVEEGLAQALSCEQPTIGSIDLAFDVGWSKSAWQSPFLRDIDALYRAGAAFVAFVLQTHGAERFMAFYAKLAAEDELAAASAKFTEVFGASLEQVWTAALANRDADRACVYPLRCAQPPLSTEFTSYRSDGLTLLGVTPEQQRSLELRFGACDATPMADVDLDRTGAGSVRAEEANLALGAGRYWIERESIARTTRPLDEVLGTELQCAELQPLAVSEREQLFAVSRQSLASLAKRDKRALRDGAWILSGKIDSPDGRVGVECSRSARVEICEGCDYTNCQIACETGRSSVAIGTGLSRDKPMVLRVHVQEDAGFWVRLRREKQRAGRL